MKRQRECAQLLLTARLHFSLTILERSDVNGMLKQLRSRSVFIRNSDNDLPGFSIY